MKTAKTEKTEVIILPIGELLDPLAGSAVSFRPQAAKAFNLCRQVLILSGDEYLAKYFRKYLEKFSSRELIVRVETFSPEEVIIPTREPDGCLRTAASIREDEARAHMEQMYTRICRLSEESAETPLMILILPMVRGRILMSLLDDRYDVTVLRGIWKIRGRSLRW